MKYTQPSKLFVIAVVLLAGVFFVKSRLVRKDVDTAVLSDAAEAPEPGSKKVAVRASHDTDKDCTDNSQCKFACMAEAAYPEAGRDKNYVYHGHCAPTGSALCKTQIKDGKLFENTKQVCAY